MTMMQTLQCATFTFVICSRLQLFHTVCTAVLPVAATIDGLCTSAIAALQQSLQLALMHYGATVAAALEYYYVKTEHKVCGSLYNSGVN